jgi:phosphoribosylformylglycinamidine synthase
MTRPPVRALVLTGFGLNCDMETAFALEQAGAEARRVHVNDLVAGEVSLDGFQILVFGGGFSWGDDHGAGVIQAVRMRAHLGDALLSFIERGKLVLGICNGFQTLVNLGLLPGLDGDYAARTVALTGNDCGNFRDQWATLAVNPDSSCVFTRGMGRMELPVRHGEGKFFAEADVLDRLEADAQVVLRYAAPEGAPAGGVFPDNPNGSFRDIAGICDPTGRVFGLMPHPEAFHHPTHHPDWTRRRALARREAAESAGLPRPDGLRILENAVGFWG